jgi:hypothetical protein
LCLQPGAFQNRLYSTADMALQAASVFCVVLVLAVLHPSVADPVTDTKLQAGELGALRSDIAALKPRVAAGELLGSNVCFGACLWWSLRRANQVAERQGQLVSVAVSFVVISGATACKL